CPARHAYHHSFPTRRSSDLTGRDGFTASFWRTRSGLGRGSACLGVVVAHGRPRERETTDGGRVETLRYASDGAHATFVCVEGKLDRKSTRLNSSHDQISYAV